MSFLTEGGLQGPSVLAGRACVSAASRWLQRPRPGLGLRSSGIGCS